MKIRSREILKDLRSRVVNGEFPPGGMLPRRKELLEHYGISVGAFQKNINKLVADGFLESHGGAGVFVSENPPHLSRFAILMPFSGKGEQTGIDTFLSGFRRAIEESNVKCPGHSFESYLVGEAETPQMKEWERFAADAENELLAGAISIFCAPPLAIQKSLGGFPCRHYSEKKGGLAAPLPTDRVQHAGAVPPPVEQAEVSWLQECRCLALRQSDNVQELGYTKHGQ